MKKFALMCAAAAIVAPAPAFAQETTGAVRGQVTSNGAPVAGATVVVVHEPSGTISSVNTDSSGAYSTSGLRVGGPYSVEVTADGFENYKVTDLFLSAGEATRLPLELGAKSAQSSEIVVTGSRVSREQSTGPITALTRTEIEGVASVNRDIRDLARRDPFATIDPTNVRAVEVAGQGARLNRFSVDGVQFSDDFGLNNGGLPTSRGPVPFDAIEQFSLKVAPFDISEGDFQGGAVNVVLRSGTNKFKGSAFYSFTNDSLTGDQVLDTPVNLNFKNKVWGGVLSGPIVKDQLFFMVAYERTNEQDPFDDGVGPGFANQVPGVTTNDINNISNIAQSVYGYDTLGLAPNGVEKDEKFIAKLDANISENHRASFTYIMNKGTQQIQQGTFTTAPFAVGLLSNYYELKENVKSGVFQLNSDWTDNFSTELRASRRVYDRGQNPFGGQDFAQFVVCLDPTSINSGSNTATSCGGSRIIFGPDVNRHANAFKSYTNSIDLTARYSMGDHEIKALFGWTKSKTFNLFLSRALGDYYFDSVADFQNRRANRLQFGAAVPSLDPNDAAANFDAETITVGVQDDWDVTPELQLTAGVRVDFFRNPDEPAFNVGFTSRYGFDNSSTFDGKSVIQPRIGFNWKPTDRLIIRGGTGVFGGGTPDIFLANSYQNTATLTNSVDITRTNCAASGTCNALNFVDGFDIPTSVETFTAASIGQSTVHAIDPDLKIASQWRSTISVNYEADLPLLGDGWLLGADLLYSKVLNGYTWTDLRSIPIGTMPDGRVRYGARPGTNAAFQDLLMTNSDKGRAIIGVARISKSWDFGLSLDGSYTRSDVKDENGANSATPGSLFERNAFNDMNRAAYGRSSYEIRDQWKLGIDYKHAFFGDYKTRIGLFGEYRTGRPYSLTMLDRSSGRGAVFGTVGNSGRALLYVPTVGDPAVVFGSSTVGGVTQTAAQAEALFNDIVAREGLEKYRGRILPKNTQDSPDFFKVDLHVSQEIPAFVGRSRVKVFADLENLLNLIDKDWGALRQVAFPSTAAVATVECVSIVSNNCTQYRYSRITDVNKVLNTRQSLWQVRFGAKFEF